MVNVKKIALALMSTFIGVMAMAQEALTASKDKGGFMRSEGKIYVVVAVIVVIVAGLFIYLFNLDRKIKRLEQEKE